jgi:hypothetical protein
MPITPDKLDIVIGLLLDIKASLGKPNVSTSSEADKFLERWARVSHEQVQAKYGVAWPGQIVAMPSYDETEAIYRARAGYATNGYATSEAAWNSAPASVGIIANATQDTASSLYETGYGLTDPDVCAYGFYVGIFKPKAEFAAGLGAGVQPRDYAGVTLQGMLAPNFGGGGPGVG